MSILIRCKMVKPRKDHQCFENKYTRDDLKTMQSWDLERKIQVSQTRILEWQQYWPNKTHVLESR